MNQIAKQQWLENFNSIHTFSTEELKVLRQAKEIQMDKRFIGSWKDALNIAIDLKFDDVEIDANAMRIKK